MRERGGKRSSNGFLGRSGRDGDVPGYYWPELNLSEKSRVSARLCGKR